MRCCNLNSQVLNHKKKCKPISINRKMLCKLFSVIIKISIDHGLRYNSILVRGIDFI